MYVALVISDEEATSKKKRGGGVDPARAKVLRGIETIR